MIQSNTIKKVMLLSHSYFLCQFDTQHNFDWVEAEGRMRHRQCRKPKHINHIGGVYG